jgi:hypothetical protein
MTKKPCKLCQLLPNAEIENLLATKPSRFIAKELSVSKSLVNNHKSRCSSAFGSQQMEETMQSLEWAGEKGVFTTGQLESDLSGMSHEAILKLFGHDPSKVEITGILRERHSEYYNRDEAKKLWKHSYSFGVQKKTAASKEDVDPIALIKELGIKSKPKGVNTSKGADSTFVLDWADWQVMKAEGGGIKGFVDRFDSAMEAALERIVELRTTGRKLDELVIIGGGDMIEGCVIYPNQSYEIVGHRRDQIRLTVATILKGIYILAPLFEKVRVVAVPGNHGENRINGSRTTIGDNDDLLVFEMAEVGIKNDPNMKHVKFEIAEKEVSLTTSIRGWVYGITHGDVYGRGSGTGVRNKVFGWFKTMAANRHAVGSADVLVTHHFHHDALEDWGATLWVQNPTMDGGSHYFVEATGHKPKHGMNSWVVTKTDRFQDKQVLR